MGKFIDETGHRYGRWVVVKRVENRGSNANWLCRCDCGKEALVRGIHLRNGNSKSCGCYSGDLLAERRRGKPPGGTKPPGEASRNALIAGYKTQAEKRGYEWALTSGQCVELFQSRCVYCGREPSSVSSRKTHNGTYTYTGIDRVDNSKGYIPGNVVPCCSWCNWMKMDKTSEEFIAQITTIYRNCVEKGTE